jgi:hypothetical protein
VIRHDFDNHASLYRIVAALLYATTASVQENRGAACAPDAFRLCGSYIADAMMVETCLRRNKSDLSNACRSVFEQGTGPVASKSRD